MTRERTHTDGISQVAQTTAFTCGACDKGRHDSCREKSGFTSNRVEVCQCSCVESTAGAPIIGALGTMVGRRMDDGRVFAFGPGRLTV